MTLKTLAQVAAVTFTAMAIMGCQSLLDDLAAREVDHESFVVHWEVRTPADAPSLKGAEIELVTNDSATKEKSSESVSTDGGYRSYKGDCLIGRDIRRFILVHQNARTVLVYALDIPKVGKPADWTPWRLADYVDSSGNTSWSLMDGKTERLVKGSSKGIPVELRYRVEKNPYSIRDALRKAGS